MEIFKKWWFYVIVGAVILLLPFSIKYALQPPEGAEEPGLAVEPEGADAPAGQETAESTAPAEDGRADIPVDSTADEPGDTAAAPEVTVADSSEDGIATAEPSEDSAGSDTDGGGNTGDTGGGDGAEVTYILNLNSRRFHLPSCSSVGDMKKKNRRDTALSRDELIGDGWIPCGRCKP